MAVLLLECGFMGSCDPFSAFAACVRERLPAIGLQRPIRISRKSSMTFTCLANARNTATFTSISGDICRINNKTNIDCSR
jgi:hypothetical protein